MMPSFLNKRNPQMENLGGGNYICSQLLRIQYSTSNNKTLLDFSSEQRSTTHRIWKRDIIIWIYINWNQDDDEWVDNQD